MLILDIDETLVSASTKRTLRYDFSIKVRVNCSSIKFFVTKRPYLDSFLQNMSQYYDICVFTAGIDDYCKKIVSQIDKKHKYIQHQYSRGSCTRMGDCIYYKDIF